MRNSDNHRLPPELEELGNRLRDERPEATPLELDRMKTAAMARASRSFSRQGKGPIMKSRLAGVLVAGAVIVGGTGGVMAATGGNPGSGGSSASAPNNQYCPPTSNNPGQLKHVGISCGNQNPGHH